MADEATNFDDEFYMKLLLEESKKLKNVSPDSVEFIPKPGYVMKLRNRKEEKVFINVCTSEKVPAAKEISEEELVKVLQSVDPSQYRVPMSLGEPHVEVDNRGQGGVLCFYFAVYIVGHVVFVVCCFCKRHASVIRLKLILRLRMYKKPAIKYGSCPKLFLA